jgi:hypothetical protein
MFPSYRNSSVIAQAGFAKRRPGFEPRSSHVGFVVDKMALGQVFSEYNKGRRKSTHIAQKIHNEFYGRLWSLREEMVIRNLCVVWSPPPPSCSLCYMLKTICDCHSWEFPRSQVTLLLTIIFVQFRYFLSCFFFWCGNLGFHWYVYTYHRNILFSSLSYYYVKLWYRKETFCVGTYAGWLTFLDYSSIWRWC